MHQDHHWLFRQNHPSHLHPAFFPYRVAGEPALEERRVEAAAVVVETGFWVEVLCGVAEGEDICHRA